MAEYYVIKTEECSNCDEGKISTTTKQGNWTRTTTILDGKPQDMCRTCNGTGKIESQIKLTDALRELSIIS